MVGFSERVESMAAECDLHDDHEPGDDEERCPIDERPDAVGSACLASTAMAGSRRRCVAIAGGECRSGNEPLCSGGGKGSASTLR
jgi:hypothetical protein